MDDIRITNNQNVHSMGKAMGETPQIEADPHGDQKRSFRPKFLDKIRPKFGSRGKVEREVEDREAPASERTKEVAGTALFFEYVLKAGIGLVVFLTPLFYFFSSDVIEISKSLLITTLGLLVLGAWVGKVITLGAVQYRRGWLIWPAIAMGVIALASAFVSPSLWVSLLGDVGRASFSVTSILAYVVIFLAAYENLAGRDVNWVLGATVASSILVSLVSLLQFLGVYILPAEFTRAQLFNTLGSVFAVSLFAAFSIPLILEYINRLEKLPAKIVLAIAGLFQLFIVLVVGFRTSWLVLAITMLAYLGLVSFKQGFFTTQWHAQRRITIPLVVLVLAVLLWALPGIPGPRLVNLPVEVNPSYGASMDVVKVSWADNILLGSGPETFPYIYAQNKDASLNQTNFWGVNFNGANAEILTWMANFGLLGSLAWLAFVIGFLVFAFNSIRKKKEPFLGISILAAWLFVVVSKFFYSTPLALEVFFWILPVLFVLQASGEEDGRSWYEFRPGSIATLFAFIGSVVLLIVSIGGLYLSAQRWIAEHSYASIFTNDGTPETRDELINNVVQAVSLNSREARYWRALAQVALAKVNDIAGNVAGRAQAQSASAAPAGQQAQQGPTQEEAAQIQNLTLQVVSALQQAQALDPQNVGLLVDVAESYKFMNAYVAGANDAAVAAYERAVELEPVNPFLKTQLAQLYLVQENFFVDRRVRNTERVQMAQEQLRRAVELNPNYSNARYFLGFILDRQNDRQGALEQFEQVFAFNQDNQAIAQIIVNLRNGFSALGPGSEELETPPIEGEEAQGVPSGEDAQVGQ